MSNENQEPQCILGNGVCPPECPLNSQSAKITEELGDDFDPYLSRLNVIFGDVNPNVSVSDIARVKNCCIKENKKDQNA